MRPLKRLSILCCNCLKVRVKAHLVRLARFGQGNKYIFGWFFPIRVFQGKSCVNDVCMIYVFFYSWFIISLIGFAYS
jgi:hypothetical protein